MVTVYHTAKILFTVHRIDTVHLTVLLAVYRCSAASGSPHNVARICLVATYSYSYVCMCVCKCE